MLDTRNKRFSIANLLHMAVPPVSDGTINVNDRRQWLGWYSGTVIINADIVEFTANVTRQLSMTSQVALQSASNAVIVQQLKVTVER